MNTTIVINLMVANTTLLTTTMTISDETYRVIAMVATGAMILLIMCGAINSGIDQ